MTSLFQNEKNRAKSEWIEKKNCRRFLEKESWEGNFMCAQADQDWNGFKFFKKMSFNI